MSPLTRQMWIDAWGHLTSARQSFGEATSHEDKERALCDMIQLSDAFKASCLAFAGALNYDKITRRNGGGA